MATAINQSFESTRWFRLWIAGGVLVALALLGSSISTYTMVSRRLIVDHLRGDIASQVSTMDEEIHRSSVRNRNQLSAILQQTMEGSKGRIAWIQVQNSDGEALSQAGSLVEPVFSAEDIRSHIQSRQPIFKTIDTSTGTLVVEVFPFRIPGLSSDAAGLPHRFVTVEIAEFWGTDGAGLWSLQRRLMINAAAALMLLVSLTVVALRLRSYVAGRQLEQEMEVARSVQLDLLPASNCELDSFEVAAEYTPLARIGGDFYDTFAVRGACAAFVVGDVAGKGIPAALLMGVLQGAIRSSGWTESPFDHQEATRRLNRLLCERTATARFASMFWSYFDSKSQHLKYINAGHCTPLLVKAHRNSILRLSSGGPVLGFIPGAEFQQGSVRLERGDVLVLYSDGIVEAMNEAEDQFGEDRLLSIVSAHSQDHADEIRNHILTALDAFTGSIVPLDDRTLVVIVYFGAERPTGDWEQHVNFELAACA